MVGSAPEEKCRALMGSLLEYVLGHPTQFQERYLILFPRFGRTYKTTTLSFDPTVLFVVDSLLVIPLQVFQCSNHGVELDFTPARRLESIHHPYSNYRNDNNSTGSDSSSNIRARASYQVPGLG